MPSAAFVGNLLASAAAVTVARARRGPLRPTWSWGYQVVIGALKARAADIARLDWPGQRRAWSQMTAPAPILKQVTRERVEHAGLPAEWFAPRGGATSSDVFLYFHGGSFIYGSIESHREVIARLALATGSRVLAIEYRLAPEHPFPAAHDDALAAYRALRRSGVPAAQIIVAGDSAGGNLAASTALAAADDPPRAAVLLSPWVDLTARGGSLVENAAYDWAEPQNFVQWAECYLEGGDPRDPRVSPLLADLSRLPRTLVTVGTAEMLHDQVTAFVARARAAGADIELFEERDMTHNAVSFAGMFPECGAAFDVIARFVQSSARHPPR